MMSPRGTGNEGRQLAAFSSIYLSKIEHS